MKHIFLPVIILSIAFVGVLFAQEAEKITEPEAANTVADADNPGMAWLDKAIEEKLRATTVLDLDQVIVLCQRANKEGLAGENLKYCNQLLASSLLQRGLFRAQRLLGPDNSRPGDWRTLRELALSDIGEAVAIVKDQPIAYLRIAQLHLLPEGNKDKAKEALEQAVKIVSDEPEIQVLAVLLLAGLEPEAGKREAILSEAARNGNPQIVMLHARALLELKRNDEATKVLRQLIESESGNVELHERIVNVPIDAGELEVAMSLLDTVREKADDSRKIQIDFRKASMLNDMERHEEALKLLSSLYESVKEEVDAMTLVLLIRSNTYLAMGNLDFALEDIEAADKLRPDNPVVLEQKYRILVEQENYNDALTIAKSLRTSGGGPRTLILEIHALLELEKYDEAVETAQEFIKALQGQDDESQGQMILLEVYSKQQAYDKALALVEEQLQKKPEELRWILAKAGVYSEQKKWNEAIQWLEKHLEKVPDSKAIQLTLIGTLADKKSFRAAKERLLPLLADDPDNTILLRIDSQLSISLGMHAEAVSALQKVVEEDQSDYTSINNLAWLLATSPVDSIRDGRRAVELAEKAGKLTQHKKSFILSTIAAAYAESGDFGKAKEWAEKSIEVAKKEKSKTAEEREELLGHLQQELETFSQDKPFRELLNEEGKE